MLTKNGILKAIERGDIVIDPLNYRQLNPNSYDLRLAPWVLKYVPGVIETAVEMPTIEHRIGLEGMVLEPGELYLMATKEVTYSRTYIPCIEGRSSVGRLGINIHATAGFGDVGFRGTWTLEVSVIRPVRIYAGMRICQIYFEECDEVPIDLYEGKYNGQFKPKPSKIYREFSEWNRE